MRGGRKPSHYVFGQTQGSRKKNTQYDRHDPYIEIRVGERGGSGKERDATACVSGGKKGQGKTWGLLRQRVPRIWSAFGNGEAGKTSSRLWLATADGEALAHYSLLCLRRRVDNKRGEERAEKNCTALLDDVQR